MRFVPILFLLTLLSPLLSFGQVPGKKKIPPGVIVTSAPGGAFEPTVAFSDKAIFKKLDIETDSVRNYIFMYHRFRDGKVKSERMTSIRTGSLLMECAVDSLSVGTYTCRLNTPGGSLSQMLWFYSPLPVNTFVCDAVAGEETLLFVLYAGDHKAANRLQISIGSARAAKIEDLIGIIREESSEFYLLTFRIE